MREPPRVESRKAAQVLVIVVGLIFLLPFRPDVTNVFATAELPSAQGTPSRATGLDYPRQNGLYPSPPALQDSVQTLSRNPYLTNLSISGTPAAFTRTPPKGSVFVATQTPGGLDQISTTSHGVVGMINITDNSTALYLSCYLASSQSVYIPNFENSTVSIVSLQSNRLSATVQVGPQPVQAVCDSSNGEVYVTDRGNAGTSGNEVSVISSSNGTVVRTITVGLSPGGEALDPLNGNLYVANNFYSVDNVTVISTSNDTVVGNIYATNLSSAPDLSLSQMAFDPVNGCLYVSGSGTADQGDTIQVLSTTTSAFVTSIYVGKSPTGIAYDAADGDVYVALRLQNKLSVISTASNSVIGNITVQQPSDVFYDPSDTDVYVAAPSADAVYILGSGSVNPGASQYEIVFAEEGLSTGTSWTVSLNGSARSSTSSSIQFSARNGTYPFAISVPFGYDASPKVGTVLVNGAPVNRAVSFRPLPTYSVTFRETGLTSGLQWGATLRSFTVESTNASVVFQEPNGTYSFAVLCLTGYDITPLSGSVSVNGSAVQVPVSLNDASVESSISVNFNGNSIPRNDTMWFNSVLKPKSNKLSTEWSVSFSDQTISFNATGVGLVTLAVPNATVNFIPGLAQANTTFSSSFGWITNVPANFSDNVFLSGFAYHLTVKLPGGIKTVTWRGTFEASAAVAFQWQWAAAVYTNFPSIYDCPQICVKTLHGTKLDGYPNGDQAGTPEAYKSYVTGGAAGGGGSNYTGSYSSTIGIQVSYVADC